MAKSLNTSPRLSLQEIVNIEGVDASMSAANYNVDAPNGYLTPFGSVLYQGDMWAYYVTNVTLNTSKKCFGAIIKNDIDVSNASMNLITYDATPLVLPINRVEIPNVSVGLKYEFRAQYVIGYATGDKLSASIHIQATRLTNDFNLSARNTILWIGDSISYGVGASGRDTSYIFKVRNYYDSKNVRLINASVSGSQSNNHVYRLQHGKYNMPYVNLVVLSLGVNDASQNLTPETVLSNYNLIISYFRSLNANCNFLIVAGTPVENDTLYSKLTSISNILMSLKNESNGIFAVSCLNAFDRKNASYYTGSDTAGNRLHPNDAGNLAIYNVVKPYLDTVQIL